MGRILYLYNSTQTYTDTVYQHIASFGKYSQHATHYVHQDPTTTFATDLSAFDAVCIHYSIRMPFDQLSPSTVEALRCYDGLKFLFMQDEYDFTHRAWYWIRELGIKLVFTVVPEQSVDRIYPSHRFPNTCFCSVLTGYVPDGITFTKNLLLPSKRSLLVGYRGRPLPVRYGKLGLEKVKIGKMFRNYFSANGLASDIAWTEEARIYGKNWLRFVASCRAMLGSESGSNVFDFDGSLGEELKTFKINNPQATEEDVYNTIILPKEHEGLMNQISPRVFEAISMRTVLILFEGRYSGALEPGNHYISVKKDGSNLREIVEMLLDGSFVDSMAERTYQDIINSGNYGYPSFVRKVDDKIEQMLKHVTNGASLKRGKIKTRRPITYRPLRAFPPGSKFLVVTAAWSRLRSVRPRNLMLATWSRLRSVKPRNLRLAIAGRTLAISARIWMTLPVRLRRAVKPVAARLFSRQ